MAEQAGGYPCQFSISLGLSLCETQPVEKQLAKVANPDNMVCVDKTII